MRKLYLYLFLNIFLLGLHQLAYSQNNENVLLPQPVTYYLSVSNATPVNGTLAMGIYGNPDRFPLYGNSPIGSGSTYKGQTNYTPQLDFYINGATSDAFSLESGYPVDQAWIQSGRDFPQAYVRKNGYDVKLMYVMIAPNAVEAATNNICGDMLTSIKSPGNWDLFPISNGEMSVEWQYSLGAPNDWTDLPPSEYGFTTYYEYRFIPVKLFPQIAAGTTNITFRCRAKIRYGSVYCYSPYSPGTKVITFQPPAPKVDANQLTIVSNCPGQTNGTVTLPASAITSGFSGMRWILRKGTSSAPCDPGLSGPVSGCGDQQDWSQGVVPVAGGISITNVPKGDYTLWVINPSANAGNCFTPVPVPMTELTELTESLGTTTQVSCFGGSDGTIAVTAAEGNGAKSGYFFTLRKDGNIFRAEQRATGNTMSWSGLPAGAYVAEVRDGTCSTVKTVGTTISQPPQVKGQLTPQHPTCISPGNGSISIVADPGITNYQYSLYKGAVLQQQSAVTTSRNYSFGGLGNGDYSVEIKNMDYASCTGWTGTVSLNAILPLTLAEDARNMVTCFGGSDGSLQYAAAGGSGSYVFMLQRSGMPTVSNSTGTFNGLKAGTYTITVQNNVPGCNDALSQPVTISEPAPLQVNLQTTNISCNGAQDGIVKAIASGGSGFYTYKWEQLKGGVWTTNPFWFDSDTQIDALSAGTYRVTVADSKSTNCSVLSGVVTITELPALQSGGVTITPVVCLADGATINISASGGDNTYTYFYTLNGTNYTAFTPGSKVYTTGTYHFRIKDGKGCTLDLPGAYDISLPAAPLSFTTQLSAYNGFQISCNGATDGKITILAAGGNGGSYMGYQYKLNNGAYQSANIFSGLTAGTYTFSVKDARGCETSGSVTLTQPQMSINATKQDVTCFGQSIGSITTNIMGGAAPYRWQLNGTTITGATANNLPAGNYTLHITDANGCTKDTALTIAQLYPALAFTAATVTDIQCFGTQGSIAMTAIGGDGSYQYSLSTDNWATSKPYTSGGGLGAGIYALKVTDNHGCSLNYNSPLTITAPPAALSLSGVLSDYNGYNISCAGGNNGSVQLKATGGNGGAYTGYQYKLNNGAYQSTSLFSGLTAGTYTISVRDARGCETSGSVTLTQPQMSINATKQDVTCFGQSTGSITTNIMGGAAPYRWQLNGTTITAATAINLPAGNYTLHITDANGCTKDTMLTIVHLYPALAFTAATVTDIQCFSAPGSIAMTATGGDGSYQYSLSTDNWATSKPYTSGGGLGAGVYVLKVTDNHGCSLNYNQQLTITTPPAPLLLSGVFSDYNGYNISCAGGDNGSVQLKATGGNGAAYSGYTYAMDNGAFGSSSLITGIKAGMHQFTVKDGRGCTAVLNYRFTESAQALSIQLVGKLDVRCANIPGGSITVAGSGGTGALQYSLNDADWQASPTFSGLTAGNYTVTVRDANSCGNTLAVQILSVNPAITVDNITSNDIVCFGTSGTIQVQAHGGSGQLVNEYAINGGAYTPFTNTSPLGAGNYIIRVKDAMGCYSAISNVVSITAPAAPLLLSGVFSDYNGYNISCAGGDNGAVQLKATGGNGAAYNGYTYAMDNGAFGPSSLITGIKADMHQLTVKDGRGCTAVLNYRFTEPAQALSLQLVGKQDVRCVATPDGSITVAGSGGTGALQYSLNGTDWQTSPAFSGLTAGNYTVTVRDANSCGNTLTVQILSVNTAITVDNITPNDIICFGTSGTIQVQAHGGSGQLVNEYALNGGVYTPFINTTPLGAGNYTIRVKDAMGCYSAVSNVVAITAPAAPLAATVTTTDFHGVQISCYGLSDGAFSFVASGGNDGGYQGYSYSVNGGAYTAQSQYTAMPAGNYAVKIKDGRGCEITKNIVLQQPAAPVSLTVSDVTHLACGGIPTGSITLQATGGTTPYAYTMNNGTPQPSPVFGALPVGNYTLAVKDVNGCAATVVVPVKEMYPPVTARATVTPVRCYGEANGSISLQPSGGDGSYSYQWSNAGVSGAQAQNITAGNYTVKVTDGKGCGQSYSYEVTQPAALGLTVTGSQVCDGMNDGTVDVSVQGGTLPYQYALNNGAWTGNSGFANLGAGEYALKVQDARGCGATGTTSITKRNVKPDVNFLVASRKNAYDTLVIKEISVPAPDFVSWTFDPQAILLGYDRGTPLIKFTTAGSYWVAMKATFGECSYQLRKDIQINAYDPLAGPSYTVPVSVIDTVMLSPNPNDGNFRFQIKLKRKQQVMVSVFDLNGRILAKQPYSPALQIDDRFALGGVNNGIFILRVVTENESRDVRFIISH